MELMQLYYFRVVAKNQHITRSAEELNVSQPAVSTVIARLERELGVPLFDRRNRAIVLNENGQILLRHANNIFLELENVKAELYDKAENSSNKICLAVTSPQFLQGTEDFFRRNPQIQWEEVTREIPEIAGMLERGEVDLALTSPGIYRENLSSTLLLQDEFMIAMHPSHRFAKKDSISLSELTNEKFVLLQKGLPFRKQTDLLFQELGFDPKIVMECDHYTRRELLNANIGITVASSSAQFRHLYDPQIRFLPIQDSHRIRDIVLTQRKGKYISKAAKAFSEYLIHYYHNISNQ